MQKYDLIIIGGGAAGMFAGIRAAELGLQVLILEKMPQLGRKLRITGKGRCNITNTTPLHEFIEHIEPNSSFMHSAFSRFFSGDTIRFFNEIGVETIEERGGRIFPASGSAVELTEALIERLKNLNCKIETNAKIDKIIVSQNAVKELVVNGKSIETQTILIATGGKSYPATGSTGDGYKFASELGHTIITPRPALVPLETSGIDTSKMTELLLKNINASLFINNKKVRSEFGDLQFSETGLTGPIILTMSGMAVDAIEKGFNLKIIIDLKPALDEKKLDNRLIRDFQNDSKALFIDILNGLLPKALFPICVEMTGISLYKKVSEISAEQRKKLRHWLKNFEIEITGYRPFKEAIITAGGVSTNEIDQQTMQSKFVNGLYFAGEVIDLHGDTGGYNLQIAFSTAWVAATSIADSYRA